MLKLKTFTLLVFSIVCFSFLTFVPNSLANSTSLPQEMFSSSSSYLMDFSWPFFSKAKAKKLEGKAIETKGKLEGDKTEELKGKAIQVQGELMETTEEAKEAITNTSENISEGLKNLGDKAEKALDK